MPTAEARVETDRADRYLVQLCRHLDEMSHMPGSHTPHGPHGGHGEGPTTPVVREVDYTHAHGTVRFEDGRWTLDAAAGALTLRVDADDEEALRRLKDAASERIRTIGRRDGLRARWH
ncbi:DUF2218 domain-containing protein [Streptomyces sp. L2]|uniref:DUF2218 domain-containing protein n=1 Tax=Streptomyces sp. L2 TaxID=2162665 RepID=UPI001010E609|nr:DUF2218 domain-containing protein [Streptomyces sp. L2]